MACVSASTVPGRATFNIEVSLVLACFLPEACSSSPVFFSCADIPRDRLPYLSPVLLSLSYVITFPSQSFHQHLQAQSTN